MASHLSSSIHLESKETSKSTSHNAPLPTPPQRRRAATTKTAAEHFLSASLSAPSALIRSPITSKVASNTSVAPTPAMTVVTPAAVREPERIKLSFSFSTNKTPFTYTNNNTSTVSAVTNAQQPPGNVPSFSFGNAANAALPQEQQPTPTRNLLAGGVNDEADAHGDLEPANTSSLRRRSRQDTVAMVERPDSVAIIAAAQAFLSQQSHSAAQPQQLQQPSRDTVNSNEMAKVNVSDSANVESSDTIKASAGNFPEMKPLNLSSIRAQEQQQQQQLPPYVEDSHEQSERFGATAVGDSDDDDYRAPAFSSRRPRSNSRNNGDHHTSNSNSHAHHQHGRRESGGGAGIASPTGARKKRSPSKLLQMYAAKRLLYTTAAAATTTRHESDFTGGAGDASVSANNSSGVGNAETSLEMGTTQNGDKAHTAGEPPAISTPAAGPAVLNLDETTNHLVAPSPQLFGAAASDSDSDLDFMMATCARVKKEETKRALSEAILAVRRAKGGKAQSDGSFLNISPNHKSMAGTSKPDDFLLASASHFVLPSVTTPSHAAAFVTKKADSLDSNDVKSNDPNHSNNARSASPEVVAPVGAIPAIVSLPTQMPTSTMSSTHTTQPTAKSAHVGPTTVVDNTQDNNPPTLLHRTATATPQQANYPSTVAVTPAAGEIPTIFVSDDTNSPHGRNPRTAAAAPAVGDFNSVAAAMGGGSAVDPPATAHNPSPSSPNLSIHPASPGDLMLRQQGGFGHAQESDEDEDGSEKEGSEEDGEKEEEEEDGPEYVYAANGKLKRNPKLAQAARKLRLEKKQKQKEIKQRNALIASDSSFAKGNAAPIVSLVPPLNPFTELDRRAHIKDCMKHYRSDAYKLKQILLGAFAGIDTETLKEMAQMQRERGGGGESGREGSHHNMSEKRRKEGSGGAASSSSSSSSFSSEDSSDVRQRASKNAIVSTSAQEYDQLIESRVYSEKKHLEKLIRDETSRLYGARGEEEGAESTENEVEKENQRSRSPAYLKKDGRPLSKKAFQTLHQSGNTKASSSPLVHNKGHTTTTNERGDTSAGSISAFSPIPRAVSEEQQKTVLMDEKETGGGEEGRRKRADRALGFESCSPPTRGDHSSRKKRREDNDDEECAKSPQPVLIPLINLVPPSTNVSRNNSFERTASIPLDRKAKESTPLPPKVVEQLIADGFINSKGEVISFTAAADTSSLTQKRKTAAYRDHSASSITNASRTNTTASTTTTVTTTQPDSQVTKTLESTVKAVGNELKRRLSIPSGAATGANRSKGREETVNSPNTAAKEMEKNGDSTKKRNDPNVVVSKKAFREQKEKEMQQRAAEEEEKEKAEKRRLAQLLQSQREEVFRNNFSTPKQQDARAKKNKGGEEEVKTPLSEANLMLHTYGEVGTETEDDDGYGVVDDDERNRQDNKMTSPPPAAAGGGGTPYMARAERIANKANEIRQWIAEQERKRTSRTTATNETAAPTTAATTAAAPAAVTVTGVRSIPVAVAAGNSSGVVNSTPKRPKAEAIEKTLPAEKTAIQTSPPQPVAFSSTSVTVTDPSIVTPLPHPPPSQLAALQRSSVKNTATATANDLAALPSTDDHHGGIPSSSPIEPQMSSKSLMMVNEREQPPATQGMLVLEEDEGAKGNGRGFNNDADKNVCETPKIENSVVTRENENTAAKPPIADALQPQQPQGNNLSFNTDMSGGSDLFKERPETEEEELNNTIAKALLNPLDKAVEEENAPHHNDQQTPHQTDEGASNTKAIAMDNPLANLNNDGPRRDEHARFAFGKENEDDAEDDKVIDAYLNREREEDEDAAINTANNVRVVMRLSGVDEDTTAANFSFTNEDDDENDKQKHPQREATQAPEAWRFATQDAMDSTPVPAREPSLTSPPTPRTALVDVGVDAKLKKSPARTATAAASEPFSRTPIESPAERYTQLRNQEGSGNVEAREDDGTAATARKALDFDSHNGAEHVMVAPSIALNQRDSQKFGSHSLSALAATTAEMTPNNSYSSIGDPAIASDALLLIASQHGHTAASAGVTSASVVPPPQPPLLPTENDRNEEASKPSFIAANHRRDHRALGFDGPTPATIATQTDDSGDIAKTAAEEGKDSNATPSAVALRENSVPPAASALFTLPLSPRGARTASGTVAANFGENNHNLPHDRRDNAVSVVVDDQHIHVEMSHRTPPRPLRDSAAVALEAFARTPDTPRMVRSSSSSSSSSASHGHGIGIDVVPTTHEEKKQRNDSQEVGSQHTNTNGIYAVARPPLHTATANRPTETNQHHDGDFNDAGRTNDPSMQALSSTRGYSSPKPHHHRHRRRAAGSVSAASSSIGAGGGGGRRSPSFAASSVDGADSRRSGTEDGLGWGSLIDADEHFADASEVEDALGDHHCASGRADHPQRDLRSSSARSDTSTSMSGRAAKTGAIGGVSVRKIKSLVRNEQKGDDALPSRAEPLAGGACSQAPFSPSVSNPTSDVATQRSNSHGIPLTATSVGIGGSSVATSKNPSPVPQIFSTVSSTQQTARVAVGGSASGGVVSSNNINGMMARIDSGGASHSSMSSAANLVSSFKGAAAAAAPTMSRTTSATTEQKRHQARLELEFNLNKARLFATETSVRADIRRQHDAIWRDLRDDFADGEDRIYLRMRMKLAGVKY